MSARTTADAVLDRCRRAGFALAGVAAAAPTAYGDQLRAWLAGGRHGEMRYLAERLQERCDPAALLPGARSVICAADRYPAEADEALPQRHGRIARYARGGDYHTVMKKRLHRLADELRAEHPAEDFRVCVDTGPVLEREHAARAGIGAVGKHTLLIAPGAGSWLLLGEIVTTLDLAASAPAAPDPCGACTRCIDACPTGAIAPWSVDATRCISYLTIEHRGAVDDRIHAAMGDWIFGCDVCQEVCPHNQPTRRRQRAAPAAAAHPAYAPRRGGFDLLEVLGWDEQARRKAFAQSALKRARLSMMKRNALIASGNLLARADDPALRARVEAIAADETEDAMVRATAQAVLAKTNQV